MSVMDHVVFLLFCFSIFHDWTGVSSPSTCFYHRLILKPFLTRSKIQVEPKSCFGALEF